MQYTTKTPFGKTTVQRSRGGTVTRTYETPVWMQLWALLSDRTARQAVINEIRRKVAVYEVTFVPYQIRVSRKGDVITNKPSKTLPKAVLNRMSTNVLRHYQGYQWDKRRRATNFKYDPEKRVFSMRLTSNGESMNDIRRNLRDLYGNAKATNMKNFVGQSAGNTWMSGELYSMTEGGKVYNIGTSFKNIKEVTPSHRS